MSEAKKRNVHLPDFNATVEQESFAPLLAEKHDQSFNIESMNMLRPKKIFKR